MIDWKKILGWFDDGDRNAYNWLLCQIREGARFVEVGSYCGRSICSVADTILQRKLRGTCVDPFHADDGYYGPGGAFALVSNKDWLPTFRKNVEAAGLSGNEGPIDTIVSTSLGASRLFRMVRKTVALAFIDADHKYVHVVEDICAWWPLIEPGGWIGGHDYYDHDGADHTQVLDAVRDALPGRKILTFGRGSCWAVKKEVGDDAPVPVPGAVYNDRKYGGEYIILESGELARKKT